MKITDDGKHINLLVSHSEVELLVAALMTYECTQTRSIASIVSGGGNENNSIILVTSRHFLTRCCELGLALWPLTFKEEKG